MAKRCQCNCDCEELATTVDKPSGMRVCDECAEYDVDSDGDVHCARSGWGKVCPDCDAEIEWGRIQTAQWQANAREGRCDCPGRLWTQTEQGGSWSTSFEAEEVEAEEVEAEDDAEAGATPCECGEATGVQCEWTGPEDETIVVEWMPHHLRASHEAAGNWGVYPLNGAIRLRVHPECADRIMSDEEE